MNKKENYMYIVQQNVDDYALEEQRELQKESWESPE